MHNQTSPYLLRNITLNQPQSCNVRHYNKINPPRCRLESYKKSFFPSCISIWNTLPEKIKKAENIRIFKTEIKIHLNMRNSPSKNFPLDHTYDEFFGKFLIQIKLSPLRSNFSTITKLITISALLVMTASKPQYTFSLTVMPIMFFAKRCCQDCTI